MSEFPVAMRHPKTGGETTAATKTSLRVLEANGWRRKTPPRPIRPPSPPPSPDPAPEPQSES